MGRMRYVWAAVKRHPIKVSLGAVLAASILLFLTALGSYISATGPSFQFLAGQSPAFALRSRDILSNRWQHDFYSFPGDFQSVCAAAQSELSALGYVSVPQSPDVFFPTREHQLSPGPSGGVITVRIQDRAKLAVFTTPENSQYTSPDRYSYKSESGWVSVEVYERRSPPWVQRKVLYPVSVLLRRMGLPV
jgi:hypothetical protein